MHVLKTLPIPILPSDQSKRKTKAVEENEQSNRSRLMNIENDLLEVRKDIKEMQTHSKSLKQMSDRYKKLPKQSKTHFYPSKLSRLKEVAKLKENKNAVRKIEKKGREDFFSLVFFIPSFLSVCIGGLVWMLLMSLK